MAKEASVVLRHPREAIPGGTDETAFALGLVTGSRLLTAGLPVTIRKAGGREELAFAQGSDVIDRVNGKDSNAKVR